MSRVPVAVETPQYAGMAACLDYESEPALPPGTLVRVPLGRREVPGVVWDAPPDDGSDPVDAELIKPVREALSCVQPLPASWRQLVAFTARYYQRALGEVALAVLPPELRKLDEAGLAKRLKKLAKLAPPTAEPA